MKNDWVIYADMRIADGGVYSINIARTESEKKAEELSREFLNSHEDCAVVYMANGNGNGRFITRRNNGNK